MLQVGFDAGFLGEFAVGGSKHGFAWLHMAAGQAPDARQRRLCGGEGFGLHTMRERAQGLPGGRLQLLSTPGAGCCIVVRCDSAARPARMDDFLGMEDTIRML